MLPNAACEEPSIPLLRFTISSSRHEARIAILTAELVTTFLSYTHEGFDSVTITVTTSQDSDSLCARRAGAGFGA